MEQTEKFRFRPAGRHIFTIGRDLIQDQYAAIVELVKNAYDADSPDVHITFRVPEERNGLKIIVEDHGHGMDRETVVNKWLVPSTDDKYKRKISPDGRVMQGRKGIGRYAAALLGDNLTLETITEKKHKTTVQIAWDDFEEKEYLDEVEISVQTSISNEPSGTKLIITGGKKYLDEWDEVQLDKLNFELKKLISPFSTKIFDGFSDDTFVIRLIFDNFYSTSDKRYQSLRIEPFPILEFYDYRISGQISADGRGKLIFQNQKARNTVEEEIPVDLRSPTDCGGLIFDLRVYDRDVDSIETLIHRGLTNPTGNYISKAEARKLLDEHNGIGVYRNGFRIRPLGDPAFDWLELNKQRVQDPSHKIGSDQVIGYVLIESEEKSQLQEKSARDGIRKNKAFNRLIDITKNQVISKLEERRFIYRKKAGLSRTATKVEQEIEKLYSFEELKKGISAKLVKSGVTQKDVDEIIEIISLKEKENSQIVDDIRQTVAIYQGQATLGKIINVILHEGRRPLNFFKNQIPNLNFWAKEIREEFKPEILDELTPITDGLGKNAETLVSLFKRLDPLAAAKRGPKKEFNLSNVLFACFQPFENSLIENKITFEIVCPKSFSLYGWEEDFYIIMTNLIDNSVFWMISKDAKQKNISVVVSANLHFDYIDYRDTGPGIEPHLIESEVIFEPEFSTKPNGTGLGLAIAGEAAMRNGLDLKAFVSDTGAYFRLQPKGES